MAADDSPTQSDDAAHPDAAPTDDEDAALMLRVRDGDGIAFETLFQRHIDGVVRILAYRVRDRAAAEDLAQDTFVRVWNARERYEPTAKFTTWLYRIATNLARNWHRDRAVRKTAPTSFAVEDDPAAASIPEPEDLSAEAVDRALQQGEIKQLVVTAVDRLPDTQREALLLRRYEDLSYQEIGERLDLTVDAVKSLLSRARANLRELLDPFWNRLQREWDEI